ncbi:ubiquitin-like protein Pup [Actinomycetaceae bacterium MB13-C1-2]|nr:ubiquitin-like protein Pup [Actinomycetaceae bacterium MB13-C1-2]
MPQIQLSGGGGPDDQNEDEFGAGQIQVNPLDALLDEIDTVLEQNAEAFVQGFVQKGGQ